MDLQIKSTYQVPSKRSKKISKNPHLENQGHVPFAGSFYSHDAWPTTLPRSCANVLLGFDPTSNADTVRRALGLELGDAGSALGLHFGICAAAASSRTRITELQHQRAWRVALSQQTVAAFISAPH